MESMSFATKEFRSILLQMQRFMRLVEKCANRQTILTQISQALLPVQRWATMSSLKMDDLDPRTEKPLYVRFLHMQDIPPVSYGARVHAGTLLGYVGNTGRSDVAHLHLDINTKNNYQYSGEGFSNDNTINPVNFFPNVQFPANYYQNGCY